MDEEPKDARPAEGVKTFTVRTFVNHQTADIAATNLEAHGISCWIYSDDAGGTLPYLTAPGGVRLVVSLSDAEAATALLDEQIPAAESPTFDQAPTAEASSGVHQGKWSPVQFLGGLLLGLVIALSLFPRHASQPRERGASTRDHYAANGKIDEQGFYENGYLIKHVMDRNHDGRWDYWAYYKDDLIMRADEDNNFDGKPDETWFYANGEAVRMQKDRDFNGIDDEFCTYSNHVIQTAEMRPNGSKFATQREIFENGVMIECWYGGDSNGDFKQIVHYDAFWNPISTNPAPVRLLTPLPSK